MKEIFTTHIDNKKLARENKEEDKQEARSDSQSGFGYSMFYLEEVLLKHFNHVHIIKED